MIHPSHPVTIRAWSLIGDLNGLGEAVMTFALCAPNVDDRVLVVALNPRTLEVTRVARLAATGMADQLDRHTLPYGVRDLAETIVRERFPQPTRHSAR